MSYLTGNTGYVRTRFANLMRANLRHGTSRNRAAWLSWYTIRQEVADMIANAIGSNGRIDHTADLELWAAIRNRMATLDRRAA